ncbi:uncharacterized protein [Typha angustifolia]|uniref:uncharacterized protein n=1 Tax=Typha angustifolia TaxID=59011 RepID=UPI003C2F619B
MEEGGGWSRRSPVALLPRLDRLDALMNYLESKHNSSRWSDGVFRPIRKRSIPLDCAIQEAHAKGSLLNRVASLEHRLAQISLEMEGSSVSSSSTVHTPESPSMRQFMSNREESLSFQSFDDHVTEHQEDSRQQRVSSDNHPLQGEVVGDERTVRNSLIEPRRADQNPGKASKKKKKQTLRRSWHCKRILGC